MQQKAQISIEYMLTLAIIIAFIALLLPFVVSLLNATLFSVEVAKAKRFAIEFCSAAKIINSLANNSRREIELNLAESCSITINTNKSNAEIELRCKQHSKKFSCNANNFEETNITISKGVVAIEKQNNMLKIISYS